jgi:peptide/nickel transport system substrate-binding protein
MRKSTAVAVSCMAAAMTLAACGGSSSGGGAGAGGGAKVSLSKSLEGASKAPACQGSPVSGGTLVYARQQTTENLDTLKLVNGNGDIFASNLMFQGLTRPDPKGSPTVQPAVADKWEVSADGKTYTFHIRPGIKFSDGSPITAGDVKFSLDRFGDPKINQTLAAVAVGYGSTKVVDDSTVEVKLQFPVASFLYNISIFPAFIVPKKALEEQGEAFWKKPVGSGPFVLKELERGSHITFDRNPNYWDQGKPYVDEVRFDFATDSNSRLLSLQGGQAQIADGIPFSQVNSLRSSKDLTLQTAKVPYFVGLWLNHKRAPLADVQVRQAMQYALDRNQINRAIFRGVGTIPNSQLMALKYDAPASRIKPYALDLAKAKQLIGQSKFPQGFDISLGYPAGYDYYKQLGLYLQNVWGQLGIKVKLNELDQASLSDRFYKGDYDMVFPYSQFTSDLPVPDEYAQFVAEPKSGLNGFFSFWKDASITGMVRKFVATTDDGSRAQQWPQIQQALNEQTPFINLMNLPFINAHANNVCGTDVDALGSDHLEDAWIAKG